MVLGYEGTAERAQFLRDPIERARAIWEEGNRPFVSVSCKWCNHAYRCPLDVYYHDLEELIRVTRQWQRSPIPIPAALHPALP